MKKETSMTWDKLPENIRKAVVNNELASLKPEDRLVLYREICEQKGLDPATRPFEFLNLNGKLTMYARKECGDQLRERNGISVEIMDLSSQDGVYSVHVRAKNSEGRIEDDLGATSLMEPEYLKKKDGTSFANPRYGKPMEGLDIANAKMKAVTKAKRRVTLSICGLGMYDESEIEAIADSEKTPAPTLEQVQAIAAKVKELKEAAVKGPKKDKDRLMREACELEATILDLPGSGHTPEDQRQPAQNGASAKQEPAAATSAPASGAKEPETPQAPKIEKAAQEPAMPEKTPEKAPEPEPTQPEATEPAPQDPPPTEKPQRDPAVSAAIANWKEHTITTIKHRDFENLKVGDVTLDKRKVVYLNWIMKFKESIAKLPAKSADAAAIIASLKEQAPEFLQEHPL